MMPRWFAARTDAPVPEVAASATRCRSFVVERPRTLRRGVAFPIIAVPAASMARIAQERDGSRTPFDKAPERARGGLPAAPHDAARVRGTEGRAGAGVRGERGGSGSFDGKRRRTLRRAVA
jgi:hypothetical protein